MPSRLGIRATDISVTDILDLISRGFTYERILHTFENLTYEDIFLAAGLAKKLIEDNTTTYSHERIRKRYLRAYEKWTIDEEAHLTNEYQNGQSIHELARILYRQPSAIKSRVSRLGLTRRSVNTM